MILLIIFAFLAGIVTILSPCILPILPIILSSSIGEKKIGKARPLGVVAGFILSFTFFTLFLSTIVKISGIDANTLRLLSIVVIILLGISMLIPKLQLKLELMFSRFAGKLPNSEEKRGFLGGVLIGLSIGLLWTPCVGPILAFVISLAITSQVTFESFLITLAYSLGTGIPMFMIIWGGQKLIHRIPGLMSRLGLIQKLFGIVMILLGISIYFNFDRKFQNWILDRFPKYGTGLVKIEDNDLVSKILNDKKEVKVPKLISEGKIKAPEIEAGGKWFNSEELRIEGLRGKVVLIDFWTYSCINCQRTLPYLVNWDKKYRDKGLVIIGVHSPEFEFEKDPENVLEAIKEFGIEYPVVQDNNFTTWRNYDNRYWPAKYFIDKDGYVRYSHFGEGDYDESERVIQELLKEAGVKESEVTINNPEYVTYSKTPETYLGYGRMVGFASKEGLSNDHLAEYSLPLRLGKNEVAFEGEWLVRSEYARASAGSSLEINFEAKKVYLVMRNEERVAEVRVSIDGEANSTGEDVENSIIKIDGDRLYEIVDLNEVGRHVLRLDFLDEGTEVYAFTFG